jgi:hypothetical protein
MSFDQHSQPDQRPRRRWWLLVIPAVVVVAGAVWLTVALLTPDRFTVHGDVKISPTCGGDLAIGGQVAILNRASEPLAVGTLTEVPEGSCERRFSIPDVPGGEPLYGVRVGSEERGVVWKSEAELRDGVSLSIG